MYTQYLPLSQIFRDILLLFFKNSVFETLHNISGKSIGKEKLHLHHLNLQTSAAEFNTLLVVLAFLNAVVYVVHVHCLKLNVLLDFLWKSTTFLLFTMGESSHFHIWIFDNEVNMMQCKKKYCQTDVESHQELLSLRHFSFKFQ